MWSPHSGLNFTVETEASDLVFNASVCEKPKMDGVRNFLTRALDALPTISTFTNEASPQHGLDYPLLELALSLTATFLHEYSIRPGSGRVLRRQQNVVRIFVPADDANLAWFAFNLSVEAIHAALLTEPPHRESLCRKIADNYQRYLAFAQQHSPDPVLLGIERGALQRAIPAYRVAGQHLQIGQGKYGVPIDGNKWQVYSQLRTEPERDEFFGAMFPSAAGGRVPVAAITGSVGKTTTCHMVDNILTQSGRVTALCTTQGRWIGSEPVGTGDCASGHWMYQMLADGRVEAAVAELARGALARHGMALNRVDVGAVLNVLDNHVGIDGIASRADLASIKRLVVLNAEKMAVLNADDQLCLAMRDGLACDEVCLVSMRADNPAILEHLAAGGLAAWLEKRGEEWMLELVRGRQAIGEMSANEIPATWQGRFRPAMVNALFASAVAHGMGVGYSDIRAALAQFQSAYENNPGRMNFYSGLPFDVLITWADGPQATLELADFIESLQVSGLKRLMLCGMGNRPDAYLLDMAKSVATTFDRFICSDSEELRNRAPGAVARLLAQGLNEKGITASRYTLATNHDSALAQAFASARPGDLLVVVTYSGTKAWDCAARLAENH